MDLAGNGEAKVLPAFRTSFSQREDLFLKQYIVYFGDMRCPLGTRYLWIADKSRSLVFTEIELVSLASTQTLLDRATAVPRFRLFRQSKIPSPLHFSIRVMIREVTGRPFADL